MLPIVGAARAIFEGWRPHWLRLPLLQPQPAEPIRYDCPMEPGIDTSRRLAEYFRSFDPENGQVIAHSTQGVVVRVEVDGQALAVKTPAERGKLRLLHRLALKREYAAYRQLQGVEGFARCHGLYAERFLALEYLNAIPLKQANLSDRQIFFDRLLGVMHAMHARGVAHGDLKSRHNVLVGRDGQPYIIDLGTAVIRKPGWHPINHRLFRYLKRIDRNGWIKLKYGGYVGIDQVDRHLLDRSMIEWINSHFRRRRTRHAGARAPRQ